MRRPSVPLAFALALTLGPAAGCTRKTEPAPEPDTIPVTTEPVQRGTIRSVVSATGIVTMLPGAEFVVTAPQPARIADIFKKEGDSVKSGDLLARFELPSLRAESAAGAAAMRAAELRVKNAQLTHERIYALIERGAASRLEGADADRELNEAQAELAAARDAQGAAERQAGQTTVRAPFDGVVSQRLRNPGDTVGTGDEHPILRIVDPRQVQVTATVAVQDTKRFAIGASGRVVAEGRPGPELVRVIERPAAEPNADSTAVALAFDVQTTLTPGTQVAVEIDAEQRSNVPLVPAIAVVRDPKNGAAVFIAAGSVAKRRPVTTGLVDAERVEILEGVKPGEMIITQGLSNVRDGTPITIGTP